MHGLAAALASIHQVEVTEAVHAYNSAGDSDPYAPDIITNDLPLTTIVLLMDEAWWEATTNDEDMNIIVDALMRGGVIEKKDLLEKRYFTE